MQRLRTTELYSVLQMKLQGRFGKTLFVSTKQSLIWKASTGQVMTQGNAWDASKTRLDKEGPSSGWSMHT